MILAIDCGTQSLRTIIFDLKGQTVAKAKIDYKPYTSARPGWAEQDPKVFWEALCKGCKQLKEKDPQSFGSIKGVGVTSQRDTMINLDKNGTPLRDAITWLDTRKADGFYKPNCLMKGALKLSQKEKTIIKTMRDGKCNWIKQYQPSLWEQTWKYVQVSGYLNFCLTGKVFDSVASMVGHIPFEHKSKTWSKKGSLKANLFPVERDKLYTLLEPGEIGGEISNWASVETGLKEGLKVVACGSDKSCETLGMGCKDTSLGSLSFGTTATVELTTSKYIEPLPCFPAYCAAYPGSWSPEIEIFRGYWMISWFKDELGNKECEEARKRGVVPEALLDRLTEQTPAGCRGLMMQPYWGPSLKDPLAKGSFIGFGDCHTRGSLYRATIEGLAYALREGLETLEKRSKSHCEKLAASGGASKSNLVCQITSDVFGKPIVRGKTCETSALGAAMLSAFGLGLFKTMDEAINSMVHYERTFYPRPKEASLYEQLFQVYKKIYPNMKGIYHDIQKITNYPEF